MFGNSKKKDLKAIKIFKALSDSLCNLLKKHNFSQITVNDLCKNAMISRSTFYAHFADKFDFLKYWLADFKSKIKKEKLDYEKIEDSVNCFINDNKKIVTNLILNTCDETSAILCDFILSLIKINSQPNAGTSKSIKQDNPYHTVFSSVCCGAVLNYFSWQASNQFPQGVPPMNPHLYKFLTNMQDWKD